MLLRAGAPVCLRLCCAVLLFKKSSAAFRSTAVRFFPPCPCPPHTPSVHPTLPPQLPKLKEPPPFEEGWVLQDGIAVTRDLYDTVTLMIKTMNAGIDVVKPPEGGGGR